jgi:glycerophosphoryl diester phosphodiesterase
MKKILLALAAAGVAIAMSGGNANAAVRAATVCPGFVAHRGEITPPQNYTSDGILAETLGIRDPRYVAVEDDAWPTSDGKFLMMHDSTVDAASNGTGPIAGHTLAYWQAHIHLNDGSVPMSLPQYLALFSKYKLGHGYLHVRSATALTEMAHELNVAAVQKYVRVMAGTSWRLKTLHSLAPTYLLEYVTGSSVDTDTVHQISVAKTYGQKRILLAAPNWKPTVAGLTALFAAGLTVEWTSYGPSQDTVATQWNFSRVLTYDVAHLRALYPAGVCP